MGMNPPKRDAWPIPRTTRHVWVDNEVGRYLLPHQGLVLEWRTRSGRWEALVMYVDLNARRPRVVEAWVREDRLRPVRSDPNDRGDWARR